MPTICAPHTDCQLRQTLHPCIQRVAVLCLKQTCSSLHLCNRHSTHTLRRVSPGGGGGGRYQCTPGTAWRTHAQASELSNHGFRVWRMAPARAGTGAVGARRPRTREVR